MYYSNGSIIFEPLKHFPQSLYKHENVILDGKNLTLKDKDQTGYIILQIQCPYIHVDGNLSFEMEDPMDIESILLSCSRYRKKWDHLKVTRKNSTFFCDIGKQYKMDKRYSFCRTLYINIEIKKDTKISDITVDSVFQCSTVSLPELIEGANQITLKGHPKTPINVKLEYALKEKHELEPPGNIIINEKMKRITWEHKKVKNLSHFYIIISSDEGCLWPVQPYKTELDLPADSRSFDLKDIKRYLVEGEKYFFKISSIYQKDGEEHKSISRVHAFIF